MLAADAPVRQQTFRALSYSFRVATNVPQVAPLVPALLEDLRDVRDEGAHLYELLREPAARPFSVYVDGELVRRVGSPLALVDELLWHVNREALTRPDPRIGIHASAASLNGRTFLFPAPAGSGKTTLVAGLLQHGASYMTDEAALIAPETIELHPYPKPMWMAPGAIRAVDGLRDRLLPEYRSLSRVRVYVRCTDLGADAVTMPLPVDLVVAPSYRQGSATTLEPMSRAECLMTLANNAFNLHRFGRQGVTALERLVAASRCYRLTIGDLDEALRALEALTGTET
jgi:hypothetical protein